MLDRALTRSGVRDPRRRNDVERLCVCLISRAGILLSSAASETMRGVLSGGGPKDLGPRQVARSALPSRPKLKNGRAKIKRADEAVGGHAPAATQDRGASVCRCLGSGDGSPGPARDSCPSPMTWSGSYRFFLAAAFGVAGRTAAALLLGWRSTPALLIAVSLAFGLVRLLRQRVLGLG